MSQSTNDRVGWGRIIGQRKCPCGAVFNLHTKHPNQSTCSRSCYARYTATYRRIRKFKTELERMRTSGAIATTDLVELMQAAWMAGYVAGWKAPHRKGHIGR